MLKTLTIALQMDKPILPDQCRIIPGEVSFDIGGMPIGLEFTTYHAEVCDDAPDTILFHFPDVPEALLGLDEDDEAAFRTITEENISEIMFAEFSVSVGNRKEDIHPYCVSHVVFCFEDSAEVSATPEQLESINDSLVEFVLPI